MGRTKIDLGMTAYDDLFQTDESRAESNQEKVIIIPLSEIDDFPEHPFKVKDDEAMQEMSESVKRFGVITPAVVRQKEDGRYELISGHRRKRACELAGIENIPVIVRDMSRDEAIIFMVDSNLQREEILPSEKAYSYKMRLEAMNRQGQRTDLTSSPVGIKLDGKQSLDILGEKIGESRNQIHRYVRLTNLTPEILQMVDDKQIAFRPAVEISYLLKEEQHALLETMESEDCTPSLEQTQRMKRLSGEGRLNIDVIFSILTEEKPNQKEVFKIPQERIKKYFKTGTPVEKMQEDIIKGLELLHRKRERDNAR